jgi:hypothetical protein
MKRIITETIMGLVLLACGSVWAAPTAPNKIAAIVIKDCYRQIEWVGIATPERFMLMHISEIDKSKLQAFLDAYHPIVFQTPDVCT